MSFVKAILFDGKRTAEQALATLEDQSDHAWIDDVAVISVSKLGFVRVNSTWAQEDRSVGLDVGWGSLTGAVIGAMFGPGGALAGALGGGSMGGLIGGRLHWSLSDPELEEFASQLNNDTSALILVAEEPMISDFVSALEPFQGRLIETKLDPEDIKEIRKALKH